MPAYVVLIIKIDNFDTLVKSGYPRRSIALAKKYGATYRMFGEGAELVEGDESWRGARPVILEFPDEKAARGFWMSDEYQEIIKLRDGYTKAISFITDKPWMTEEEEEAYLKAHP